MFSFRAVGPHTQPDLRGLEALHPPKRSRASSWGEIPDGRSTLTLRSEPAARYVACLVFGLRSKLDHTHTQAQTPVLCMRLVGLGTAAVGGCAVCCPAPLPSLVTCCPWCDEQMPATVPVICPLCLRCRKSPSPQATWVWLSTTDRSSWPSTQSLPLVVSCRPTIPPSLVASASSRLHGTPEC